MFLKGQGNCVPKIVGPDVLQSGASEDSLVKGSHRIRAIHGSGSGGGEEPGSVWVLGPFPGVVVLIFSLSAC